MKWKSALSVFFGMLIADVVWTICVISVSDRNIPIAAISTALSIYISSSVTIEYVRDPKLRYAAVVGGVVGTVLVLKYLAF
jgi:hypothetical protein